MTDLLVVLEVEQVRLAASVSLTLTEIILIALALWRRLLRLVVVAARHPILSRSVLIRRVVESSVLLRLGLVSEIVVDWLQVIVKGLVVVDFVGAVQIHGVERGV